MASTGVISKRLLVVMTLVMMTTVPPTEGHGMLLEPPSRSSMWRFGYSTPKNYDDNALNCGGLNTEWYVNHGKCGVCGDPWDQPPPRDNEAGGRYGKGIITRTYRPGQTIDIRVQITANHRGWFEFRLCEHNSPTTPITHECLDKHLLQLADGSGTRYPIDPHAQMVNLKLKLPGGVTCSQCVLQWKWHGGNNYGNTQEEFYGCSDIAIGASAATTAPSTARPTSQPTLRPTAVPTSLPTSHPTPTQSVAASTPGGGQAGSGTCHAVGQFQGVPDLERYCQEQCPLGNCPAAYCACSSPPLTTTASSVTVTPPRVTTPPPRATTPSQVTPHPPTAAAATSSTLRHNGNNVVCHAAGVWQGVPELDLYCSQQCPVGMCPPQCACTPTQSGTTRSSQTTTLKKTPFSSRLPTTHKNAPTTAQTVRTTKLATSTTQSQNVVCHAMGSWQGVPELDLYCKEQCPRGNCPPQCACAPAQSTSTQTAQNVVCHALGTWQGVPELDLYCREQCSRGSCPPQCACTQSTNTQAAKTTTKNAPLSFFPVTASASPPVTTTSTTTSHGCVAIGSWQGDVSKDQWCNTNCPTGLCPSLNCRCGSGVTTPGLATSLRPTTSVPAGTNPCRAVGPWAGDPLLDVWCKQTCSQYAGCDPHYCRCDGAGTPSIPSTSAPLTTIAARASTSPARTECHAINGWAGNPDLDRYCEKECKAGGPCPPEYCSCSSAVTNGATTGPPKASTSSPVTCYAVNSWAGNADLDRYCDMECKAGLCPPQYCACGPTRPPTTMTQPTTTKTPSSTGGSPSQQPSQCRAIGTGQGVPELDAWCRTECARGNCPRVYCAC